ncbi:MAG: hypothetical protein DMG67_05460 [Acidobacteria bacterium]|nr:MAG: hypothetical protein DMG67_05460 [Acidobacteriota bacterium]
MHLAKTIFLLQFRLILLGYYLPVTTNLGHLRGYRYAFDKPGRGVTTRGKTSHTKSTVKEG